VIEAYLGKGKAVQTMIARRPSVASSIEAAPETEREA
jgi:hypothetical protein